MLEGPQTNTIDTLSAEDSLQELRDLIERLQGELKFKQTKIEALDFEIARLKRWRVVTDPGNALDAESLLELAHLGSHGAFDPRPEH